MIQELWHCSESLFACRTAGRDDPFATLRHRLAFVNECGEIVPVKFAAE
jgi:hypothetical protein